jgi:hypothetical protein
MFLALPLPSPPPPSPSGSQTMVSAAAAVAMSLPGVVDEVDGRGSSAALPSTGSLDILDHSTPKMSVVVVRRNSTPTVYGIPYRANSRVADLITELTRLTQVPSQFWSVAYDTSPSLRLASYKRRLDTPLKPSADLVNRLTWAFEIEHPNCPVIRIHHITEGTQYRQPQPRLPPPAAFEYIGYSSLVSMPVFGTRRRSDTAAVVDSVADVAARTQRPTNREVYDYIDKLIEPMAMMSGTGLSDISVAAAAAAVSTQPDEDVLQICDSVDMQVQHAAEKVTSVSTTGGLENHDNVLHPFFFLFCHGFLKKNSHPHNSSDCNNKIS